MSFDVPEDLRYEESHEWVTADDDETPQESRGDGAAVGTVRIGITDFAQDELGDVVFVELPDVGDELDAGVEFGVVESIKAVSDLYAPVSGEVTAVNEELFDRPELVNDDPYGDGWMLEVEPSDRSEFDDLLSPEEYGEQIA